ncbi:endolytic transglycosylase MltG [Deinococcus lacus]|uniref:Endolytic murein transglycosylase n=1 Tax=Deinococcus lacus TaxID=392561 RepID=A0ABW1YBB1_9DEIO
MSRLQGERRRGLPLWAKVLMSLLVLTLLAGLGGLWYLRSLTQPAGGGAYTLVVEPGDSLPSVAAQLEEQGIIRNAQALRYTMKQAGTAGSLKEGAYDLSGDMTLQEVADTLAGPARLEVVNVTVPEGKRVRDIPAIFAKAGFDAGELEAALNDASLSPYTEGRPNLEGFVFPATYEFLPGDSGKAAVQKMLERMEEEFTPEAVAAAKALGLNVFEWVTLASMVQAEAANNEEMPIIAGVFLNRVRDGMTLGSDPTVAYGLGKDLPELDRSAGDFKQQNGYNTYVIPGLPEGPINNPGHAALQSILQPQRTLPDGRDAVYFLHGLDGNIYVNHTYEEHQRDICRYRSC